MKKNKGLTVEELKEEPFHFKPGHLKKVTRSREKASLKSGEVAGGLTDAVTGITSEVVGGTAGAVKAKADELVGGLTDAVTGMASDVVRGTAGAVKKEVEMALEKQPLSKESIRALKENVEKMRNAIDAEGAINKDAGLALTIAGGVL